MSWPLSQDYNESIQDPRNSFSDAELKTGEAVANPLGIPLPRSGNFADVYEVRCPSGSRWAVKCFTREVAGLRERYHEISKFLHQANLPFMVDFKYLEQGIRVRGGWYPILKMQWVEGSVLNEFVRDNLDKKPILQAMGQIWLRMARRLRDAKLAHCDLQHGNVLLVPGSTANSLAVKLIDYDGMCVPALAGKKSGEVGHPAFQHPERLKTGAYNQEVDRFSLLAIAAGLRCLTVGGRSLWERYDNGDNLLFRHADLQAPAESALFQELFEIPDPQAQSLVKELFRACRGPLDKVPLLTDLIPEEKPAAGRGGVAPPVQSATAKESAAAQGADWDFNEGASAPSVAKKPRASGKTPKWIWAAVGGAAAVLLLGVGVGAGLMMRNGPAENEATPVVQNRPETKKPTSAPKPSLPDVKPLPTPVNPPPNPVNPPPTLGPAAKFPGVSPLPGRVFVLSPAGDSLAFSNEGDKIWRLVNPRTKELIREFVGHEEPIAALAFSSDGTRAVSLGGEKMLRLWDLQTGKMIGSRTAEGGPVVGMAISADGKGVLTADLGREVTLWNFETGMKVSWSNDKRKASSVACSPDCRFFVSGYDKSDKEQDEVLFLTHLVDDVTDRSFRSLPTQVTALAVSRDGKYIASGQSGETCVVSIWEAATGKLVKQMPMGVPTGSKIQQVAFSPNGEVILGASGHHLRAWRVSSGQSVPTPSPEIEPELVCGGFSPDSKHLLYAGRTRDRVHFYSAPVSGAVAEQPNLAWEKPTDPDGDCPFKNVGGKLTIDVPGKDHDLDAERGRVNAPRVLREVTGDFTVQVCVSGDFQPSTDSTAAERVPFLGAGLVLWIDDKTFFRLERAVMHKEKEVRIIHWAAFQNGRRLPNPPLPPLPAGEEIYVRLERQGRQILAFVSTDGQRWNNVMSVGGILLPEKVKIGVLACSTSAHPFAPSFDQFQLKRGRGEMLRVNLPLAPAAEPVVVKPPGRRPRRSSNKLPVPDEQTLADKRKLLQEVRYKDDYNNGKPKRTLPSKMCDESRREFDTSLRYVMLSEARDLAARDGDLATALRAVSELIATFDVEPLESKCRVVEQALLATAAKDKYRLLTRKALLFLDRAVIDEDFERGERLLKVARAAALKADMTAILGKMVDQADKQFKAIRNEYEEVKDAARKLEAAPDDPAANLALGHFRCFVRGDWDAGLPLLVKGDDKALRELAQKDVADPVEAAAQAAVGDAWADYADKAAGKEEKTACRLRAYFWYQECLDDLEKKDLTRVKKRLSDLKSKVPELSRPFHDLDHPNAKPNLKTGVTLLHVPAHQPVATRRLYHTTLDIRVTALLPKGHIRISFLNGGEIAFDPEGASAKVRVYRPFGADPDERGTLAGTSFARLTAGSLQEIRIQVTRDGWKVWLNNQVISGQGGAGMGAISYAPSPVRVWSEDGDIDIKSIVVKTVR